MLGRLSFAGRGCVVTGGSKGIGRAVAVGLAELGGCVVACGRGQAELDALAQHVASLGLNGKVEVVQADVSNSAGRAGLMDAATAVFSREGVPLSVLVNNVGTNLRKPTAEYTEEEWGHIIGTNLQSAFHLSQLAHPMLEASAKQRGRGGSAVVNISSVSGGPTCTQTGSVYASTKAAMNQLTKYTACEWAPAGIRVNAIAPWYIRTPLAEGVLAVPEYADAVLARTPARRVGEPSEVADATVYLASDAASYVTGTVLHVDGGFTSSGFGFYDGFAIPAPVKRE